MARSPFSKSICRLIVDPATRPIGASIVPDSGVFPEAMAMYSLDISRLAAAVLKIAELNMCFAIRVSPDRVTVKAVDAAESIWNLLVIVIAAYGICKRMIVMIQRRVNGHLSRLVYGEDILVLITDRKRHGDR